MNVSNPGFLLILLLLALAVILAPASAVNTVSASYTSGAGTPDEPPRDATAYIADAQAAVAIRDWPSVLTTTTRGLAWYPDNADLLCLHGYTLRKLGQYDRAVEAVSKGILLDPKPVRYANRGYAYLALGNYSAALADADAALAINEEYATAWGVKALALHGSGMTTGALAAADRALALDNGSAHYWHIRGMVLASGGDCAGARDALQKSLDLDPSYVLPWPGFLSAREELAALDESCTPATAPSTTTPQAGVPVWMAAAAFAGAMMAAGLRK